MSISERHSGLQREVKFIELRGKSHSARWYWSQNLNSGPSPTPADLCSLGVRHSFENQDCCCQMGLYHEGMLCNLAGWM